MNNHEPYSLNESTTETGSQVGDLAMGLFGDFVEVPHGDLGEMAETAKNLLAHGTPVINELYASDRLSSAQRKQVEHKLFPGPPQIDAKPIREFMSGLSLPALFSRL